jgi:hypothetical protein
LSPYDGLVVINLCSLHAELRQQLTKALCVTACFHANMYAHFKRLVESGNRHHKTYNATSLHLLLLLLLLFMALLQSINKPAEIIECTYGRVPIDQLLGIQAFSLDRVLAQEPDFLVRTWVLNSVR